MNDRLTYYVNEAGEHRWRVQAAGNHEKTLGATQGYNDRADAEANARRYLTLRPTDDADVFEVVPAEQVDVDALFADLRATVRSGSPTAPLVTAAQEAIERRLRWASVHWGTEGVHPDAWPHIAAAACEGVEMHLRAALAEGEAS